MEEGEVRNYIFLNFCNIKMICILYRPWNFTIQIHEYYICIKLCYIIKYILNFTFIKLYVIRNKADSFFLIITSYSVEFSLGYFLEKNLQNQYTLWCCRGCCCLRRLVLNEGRYISPVVSKKKFNFFELIFM